VELPELVRAYLERCLPAESPPTGVRIRQTGAMWKHPGARAQRFDATELFAVDHLEFTWRARFPILGPLALHVTDDHADGRGHMRVRIAGVPVARATGPEIAVGGALRYLAELPWAPYAMACNRQLEWRELDARTVEVSAVVAGARQAVTLEFGDDGDIVRAAAEHRPYMRNGGYDLRPWAGDFSRYEVLGGMRMPTAAEVHWDLPAGRFVYWRGTVTEAATVGELRPRHGTRAPA
jgi:hypothetical protein